VKVFAYSCKNYQARQIRAPRYNAVLSKYPRCLQQAFPNSTAVPIYVSTTVAASNQRDQCAPGVNEPVRSERVSGNEDNLPFRCSGIRDDSL